MRVPNGGIQPQTIAAGGKLHLLYFKGDPAHGDLYYVTSADGGRTWSEALRVNSQEGSAVALGTIRGGQMALGRNGRVYVVWNGSSVTQPEGPENPESGKRDVPFLFAKLNDGGTAFEAQRNLMTRTFGLDGGGTVTADGTGNVYVAWHGKTAGAPAGEAGRQVWMAKSKDDGQTFAAEEPVVSDQTGACGCCGMAMYADTKGTVYGLYRSAKANVHRDVYLFTSQDHAKTFAAKDLHPWDINACPMTSMGFAENSTGVEATWETGGQIYFENISDPNEKPVAATGDGKGRKHSRLAVSGNGDTLLVWTEGTGWRRGGSVAWQIYDRDGKPVSGAHGTYPDLPAWSFAGAVATPDAFVIVY